MGEAKRRRQFDPNFGVSRVAPNSDMPQPQALAPGAPVEGQGGDQYIGHFYQADIIYAFPGDWLRGPLRHAHRGRTSLVNAVIEALMIDRDPGGPIARGGMPTGPIDYKPVVTQLVGVEVSADDIVIFDPRLQQAPMVVGKDEFAKSYIKVWPGTSRYARINTLAPPQALYGRRVDAISMLTHDGAGRFYDSFSRFLCDKVVVVGSHVISAADSTAALLALPPSPGAAAADLAELNRASFVVATLVAAAAASDGADNVNRAAGEDACLSAYKEANGVMPGGTGLSAYGAALRIAAKARAGRAVA